MTTGAEPPINLAPQGPQIPIRFHSLEVGQIVEATVRRVEDYGAFVDVDNTEDVIALLSIIEISWARVSHPTSILSPGQRIAAMVLAISLDRSRISLSLKALEPDPWQGIDIKYPLHSIASGRVSNIADYGVFVELEPGIEGMAINSATAQAKPGIGAKVQVQILAVDSIKRRIHLDIK